MKGSCNCAHRPDGRQGYLLPELPEKPVRGEGRRECGSEHALRAGPFDPLRQASSPDPQSKTVSSIASNAGRAFSAALSRLGSG